MSPWWGILAGLFPRSGTFFPPERDVFPPDSEFLTREGIDDTVVLGNLSPPLEMNFHSGTLDYLSAPYRIGALAIRYLPPAPTGSIRIQGQQVLSSTHFIQPTLFNPLYSTHFIQPTLFNPLYSTHFIYPNYTKNSYCFPLTA